jgi:hypothetical protein
MFTHTTLHHVSLFTTQYFCIVRVQDFVRLMSSELAANPEFALPEHYFRVSREVADERAGKFFSRIERISWDEMDI